MREVITLQFGPSSNFFGAHYWNGQDEAFALVGEDDSYLRLFDMNRLYRRSARSITPRLVLFDDRDAFGSLNPQIGAANAHPYSAECASTWSGPVSLHASERVERNQFQRMLDAEEQAWKQGLQFQPTMQQWELNDVVQRWSDYLKVNLHPKTCVPVALPADGTDFRHYACGLSGDVCNLSEEITDRFRFFLEESDTLMGLQTFVDLDSGWGGFGHRFLQYVREECPRTPVCVHAIVQAATQTQTMAAKLHQVGTALAYAQYSEYVANGSGVVIPVSKTQALARTVHLRCKNTLYHTTAVMQAAYETYTCTWRKLDGMEMTDWITGCTQGGRYPIATSEVSLPFPRFSQESIAIALSDFLAPQHTHTHLSRMLFVQQRLNPFTHSLFPETHSLTLVNEPTSYDTRAFVNALYFRTRPQTSSRTDVEKSIYSHYAQAMCTLTHLSTCSLPLPLPISYPKFFSGVDESGVSLGQEPLISDSQTLQCAETGVCSAIGAAPFVGDYIARVAEGFNSRHLTTNAQLLKAGLQKEELDEVGERLMCMRDAYTHAHSDDI